MGIFEARQYFPEEEKPTRGETEKIEIPEEEWRLLEIIAKRVGGDFGMEVKLGDPGGGSFFDTEDGSITFDPLYIKENLEQAKFIAGHEGSHRAITPHLKELGLSQEKIGELYSQIGFDYLQNVIEDPAVNDWMGKRFPGLKRYTEKFYNEQLKEEGVVLGTPEVQIIATQLGYQPKFAYYGSEIIRDWHQGRFSQKLDPAVEKALQRTIDDARRSRSTIPNPDSENPEKKEIIQTAQERFRINTEYIWPEVKKLVEMDLHTEEQRQMLKDFRQKQKKLKQKRNEMKQAQKEGNKERQEELQREIEELEKELSPFNGLPEDVKKELQEQIDRAVREAAEKLNQEIEEDQRQIEEAKRKQEELEREIQELEEKAKSAQGKEKEESEKQIEKKKVEKLEQEMKQKQAEKELKDIQDALEDTQSGEEMPYPEDKLSEGTKQELEKLFNKLPRQKREELKDKAREQLEDFEDKINEESEGKLNPDKPESHRERREREAIEREAAQRSRKTEIEKQRIEEELEQMRKEKMTPYERTRAKVIGLIDDLYYRLRRILKPEEYGGEEAGYPAGQRLDISRAMQAKADVEQKYKLWIRETAPERKDYRFWHLVDLSGSMAGGKIEETFKGFIVAGEAIDRIEDLNSDTLTIHQGITGFHNRIFPFKEIQERFTKEVEDKLSTIPERTQDDDAGTNTYSATLFALEALKQNLGETANFLLTFSDGGPNYDIRDNLKELLKETKAERERLKIKIGLIWLGEEENGQTLQELVREYGYDFGLVMQTVKPEKGKGFSEALADLLEDIIRNPEKY